MSALTGAILFLAATLASLFMAWTIGAGSAGSTPFAPAVGARAISVLRAAFIVGIFIFIGAVVQGASVSEAVGRELISGVTLSPVAAAIALAIAASLVTVGVFTGYPIATAFTVTGAVIGVGLAMGGDPNWSKYVEIIGMWLLTPIVGGSIAFGIARWLRDGSFDEAKSIAILGSFVGMVSANIELTPLGGVGLAGAVTQIVPQELAGVRPVIWIGATVCFGILGWYLVGREVKRDLVGGQQRFTIVMGAIVAFSAGGSQVGLAVGPLLPLYEDTIPLVVILLGGGLGLLLGAWTGAPRLIKAVSSDFASLGPRRALAALIPSFVIAQTAILLGVPVSFNEIIVSAVVGSGAAVQGSAGVSRAKIGYTLLGWTVSFVGAIVLGYTSFGLTKILG